MGVIPLPLLAMAGGALLLVLALATLVRQRRTVEIVPNKGEVVIPSSWDERAITNQVHLYSKEPALLSHYVFAVKERLILGQNDRTIRKRTEVFKAILEQATVAKDLAGVSYEMARMKMQHEVDMMNLDLQR